MKIKVYIMHSEKVNYKEEIYKPLLEKNLMDKYYLVLPMTKRFISNYVKDLIKDSDIIICNLSKSNYLLKYELKIANKLNKDIYYFIDENDKKIKKYNNINIVTYKNIEEFTIKVEKLLDSLNKKEILLKRENIFCLGKIQNNI
ncbi:MAG: hypothetical protein IJD92_01800 [Bacilli bacterium]|nr:hypothetical protein [Bacilli bacterium]